VAGPRHEVVDEVGQRSRHDTQDRGEGPPGPAGEAQALLQGGGSREEPALRRSQEEAVGQGDPITLTHEGTERLAPERGEAERARVVELQEQADRQVAEAASPVVEEDGQGVSARRAATRASMLATVVKPSRRKRTVADPSGPGLLMSRIIFVGKAASSRGSTRASPQ